MTLIEMIEEFICPGCVSGSDTKCGNFKTDDGGECLNHVIGTLMDRGVHVCLGMPKGFNKTARSLKPGTANTMPIFCWHKEDGPNYDNFNIPVWALEKDGYLFVRAFSPRINTGRVDIIEGGKIDMLPKNVIDVSTLPCDMD